MEKFEYRVLMLNNQQIHHLEKRLNELSHDGWRAIHFDRPMDGGWAIVFERIAVGQKSTSH